MSGNLIDTSLKKHVMLPFTWKTCQFELSHEKHIRLPVIWKTCQVTCHMKNISGFITPVICESFHGKKTYKKDASTAYYNSALELL